MEAASLDRDGADEHVNGGNHLHVDNDGKGDVREASRGGGLEDEGTALITDTVTTREVRQAKSLNGVFVRLFSLGEVLRVRRTKKGKRRCRIRIWVL